MKVVDLVEKLNLKVFTPEVNMDIEIKGGYVSDLLSDVMGNAQEGEVWVTLQNHLNVVAIASLKDLAGVILVKGIQPTDEVLKKAIDEEVAILGISEGTFETSGQLYKLIK